MAVAMMNARLSGNAAPCPDRSRLGHRRGARRHQRLHGLEDRHPAIVVDARHAHDLSRHGLRALGRSLGQSAHQMTPAFLNAPRLVRARPPSARLDRRSLVVAIVTVCSRARVFGRSPLRGRRQPDGRASMPASTSAARASSPSSSPAPSRASAAISGSRATPSPMSISRRLRARYVVAACVIGGISIAGGIGSVAGAVLGALFLGVIKNALPVINVSPFWQMAISGTRDHHRRALQRAAGAAQGPSHPPRRRQTRPALTEAQAEGAVA